MLYSFANRRRAKDTVMLIITEYGTDGMMVFVQDEMVIIDPGHTVPEDKLGVIMHYAEPVEEGAYDLSLGTITELYRGQGLSKFRI